MTRDEVFPSKSDLKGKPYIVTIESARFETLKSLDGKETQKIVLHFKNAEKTLPLNATNFDAVCDWLFRYRRLARTADRTLPARWAVVQAAAQIDLFGT
jgi:hypothetical protein